ncbi:biotin biosynthesis protein BioY [Bifidobacterium castoris]|uniref:Biotin biosynthesis protein BioY n=2 Tax=Bifidobacterium castoris TaxID=2306972 RepID=A0A430F522_9BIFI|nr:biotin biosynthesis protein BioY [Bifidobacterium castoris]
MPSGDYDAAHNRHITQQHTKDNEMTMNQHSNHSGSLTIRTPELTIRRVVGGVLPVAVTAGALWAAAAIGRIAIPGTPVPITLQTLVLMIAAVTLDWRRVAGAVALYLTMGLCGLPVFSGGMSTAALIGPTCGFLYAFLPAGVVTSLLGAHGSRFAMRLADASGSRAAGSTGGTGANAWFAPALVFAAYLCACVLGCVLLQDGIGVLVQAATTHVPLKPLAMASAAFIPGDLVKAALAASLATPIALAKLR